MRIESLRYLIELSHHDSFYEAAKHLFISQQGLSKSIASLEKELDVRLVERQRNGMRLTPEGRLVVRHAKQIVTDCDRLTEDLIAQEHSSTFEATPIPLRVSYYAAQVASGSREYMRMLRNSSYIEEPFDKLIKRAELSDGTDLVFLDLHGEMIESIKENEAVVFEPIFQTHFGVVCQQGTTLAAKERAVLQEVCDLPIAVNTFREMSHYQEWLFQEYPLSDIRMGATNPRMLLDYILTSDEGIATFDSFGFYISQLDDDMPTDGLAFVPLDDERAVSYVGFLYPAHRKLSGRAKRVASFFKRYIHNRCSAYFDAYPLLHPV